MKNITKIALASVMALTLSACSSTKEPLVYDNFQANNTDSFAKTIMRLAGSNKFVDSSDGIEATRQVAGASAMQLGQLLMLDFAGAATSAINESALENEPLAKQAQFIVKVKNVSLSDLKNANQIVERASKKIDQLASENQLMIADEKSTSIQRQITYKSNAYCENANVASISCAQYLGHGYIGSYDKLKSEAYVVFETRNTIISLFMMNGYRGDDVYLYHPRKISGGTFSSSYGYYAGSPIVIHQGKVYHFISNEKAGDGLDLDDLRYIFYRKNDDKKQLFDFNSKDMSFSELPLDAKL